MIAKEAAQGKCNPAELYIDATQCSSCLPLITNCGRKLEIDAAAACRLERLQAYHCHCHAQPTCVVARSRWVQACRCDAVDAPAGCEPGT